MLLRNKGIFINEVGMTFSVSVSMLLNNSYVHRGG